MIARRRMRELYYAYGSNMSTRRLLSRVPDARTLGRARLAGMRLVCNKPGRDGSGKANLVEDAGAHVWGVLYDIHVDHWALLDRHEPGYARETARVETDDGRAHERARLARGVRARDRGVVRRPGWRPALIRPCQRSRFASCSIAVATCSGGAAV